ncbi:hypothetical protein Tco_0795516 [Tanacetum coccineum]
MAEVRGASMVKGCGGGDGSGCGGDGDDEVVEMVWWKWCGCDGGEDEGGPWCGEAAAATLVVVVAAVVGWLGVTMVTRLIWWCGDDGIEEMM